MLAWFFYIYTLKNLKMKNYLLFGLFFFIMIGIKAQTEQEKIKIVSSYDLKKSNQVTQYLLNENKAREQRIQTYLNQFTQQQLLSINQSTIRDVLPDGTVTHYVNYNDGSAKTIRANRLYTGGSLGLNVNGENMIAGLWEAENGYPRSTHLDLTGRVTVIDGGSNINFHATHVAGTIISSGDNITLQLGRGIAYEASVLAADSNNDFAEMSGQAATGLLVSNHSYGYGADGLPIWTFGAYNSDSFTVDLITNTNPYYLPVVSAGNDRDNFASYNPTKGGYDLLTGQSNAKNTITSAAVSQVLNYTGPSSVTMSTFSNWGPADDGRIKPDISSKGVGVLSTSNTSDTAYSNSQGTSMSAPAITGLLLLMQQHYNNVNSQYMLAATAKGLLLHSADEAGFFPGPDYSFGWGLANGEKSAQTITNNGTDSFIEESNLSDAETKTFNIVASGNEPLMVSISWTDPQGTAENNQEDNRTPDLVNDLDLKLNMQGTDYFPWKLNYNSPSSAATRNSTNDVDNFEKVEVDAPNAGEVFSVTINHKGSLQGGSQNFSYIITGGIPENLSVEDNSLSNLTIWPNPTDKILNYRFNSANSNSSVIRLVDIHGRTIYNNAFSSNNQLVNGSINTEALSKGIYFLRIEQGNASTTKKVIIK